MTVNTGQSIITEPETEKVGSVGTISTEVADAVRRYQLGKADAMADVARSTRSWLFHICRGYRLSPATAEDVVQNTLVSLIEHVHDIREPRCALAWLTVVARREALRAIKAEQRSEPVKDLMTLDSAAELSDPGHIVEDRFLRSAVHRNLAKLG